MALGLLRGKVLFVTATDVKQYNIINLPDTLFDREGF